MCVAGRILPGDPASHETQLQVDENSPLEQCEPMNNPSVDEEPRLPYMKRKKGSKSWWPRILGVLGIRWKTVGGSAAVCQMHPDADRDHDSQGLTRSDSGVHSRAG